MSALGALRFLGLAVIVYGAGGVVLGALPTWTVWTIAGIEVVFMWFVGFPWLLRTLTTRVSGDQP